MRFVGNVLVPLLTLVAALPLAAQQSGNDTQDSRVELLWFTSSADLILRDLVDQVAVPLQALPSGDDSDAQTESRQGGNDSTAQTESRQNGNQSTDTSRSPDEDEVPAPPYAPPGAESVTQGPLAQQIGITPDWRRLEAYLNQETRRAASEGYVAVVLREFDSSSNVSGTEYEARWLVHQWKVQGVQFWEMDGDGRPAFTLWVVSHPGNVADPYLERYRYDRTGGLRAVRRCNKEGCVDIRYDGLTSERIIGPDWGLSMRYGPRWQPTAIIRTFADGRRQEEQRTYEDGRLVASTETVDGTTIRRWYEAGRIVREEVVEEGFLVRSTSRQYDDAGRLLVERTEGRRSVVEERYQYPEDETVELSRFVDGNLVLSEERRPDGVTIETEYYQGEPAVRVYYQDEVRYKEEIILDGEVVRTRRYDTGSE